MVHIGCEAASFVGDIRFYRGHGYVVEKTKVFDASTGPITSSALHCCSANLLPPALQRCGDLAQ
ncbi:hypothetical protein ABFA25_11460 [Mycobacterium lepromatosis]|nr:hypothetical protein [Mycobacterium lepromatosis]